MTTREFIETLRQFVERGELADALDYSNRVFPEVSDRLSLDEENIVGGLVEYATMAMDGQPSRCARTTSRANSITRDTCSPAQPSARGPRPTMPRSTSA